MTLASRQTSCGCCGRPIRDSDTWEVELIVDGVVRPVAVHVGHHTGYTENLASKKAGDTTR